MRKKPSLALIQTKANLPFPRSAALRNQMPSAKSAILTRIREALREPAPVPGHHGEGALHRGEPPKDFGSWLPEVGDGIDARIEAFAKNSAELKTEFHVLASRDELPARLAALAAENTWKRVATHAGVLADAAVPAMNLPTLKTDGGYDKMELEKCDAGISECDALVAQTGGVLVTGRSAGGRALSVLPPHHVVVATRDQLVPDLPPPTRCFASVTQRTGRVSFRSSPARAAPATSSASSSSARTGRSGLPFFFAESKVSSPFVSPLECPRSFPLPSPASSSPAAQALSAARLFGN